MDQKFLTFLNSGHQRCLEFFFNLWYLENYIRLKINYFDLIQFAEIKIEKNYILLINPFQLELIDQQ